MGQLRCRTLYYVTFKCEDMNVYSKCSIKNGAYWVQKSNSKIKENESKKLLKSFESPIFHFQKYKFISVHLIYNGDSLTLTLYFDQ